jgi:PAS domain S-box-containing protein
VRHSTLFHPRSLVDRLSLIGIVTSLFSVLLTAGGLTAFGFLQFRAAMRAGLKSAADVLALTNTAPISFGDIRAATENLSVARADSHVLWACLYDRNGRQFAKYVKLGSPYSCPDSVSDHVRVTNTRDNATYSSPILVDGEKIGTISICRDPREGLNILKNSLLLLAAILTSVLSFATWLSSRMSVYVGRPIQALVDTSRRISEEQNYSLRVGPELSRHDDDLRPLIESFNHMISKIEISNHELALHREKLEEQVAVRTAELNEAKAYVDDILQSMADSLLVVDCTGMIQTANPAACELLGYEDGKLFGELIKTVMPNLLQIHSLGCMDEGILNGAETVCITREGVQIPVLASVALMRAREDMAIIMAQDLREMKRVEHDLVQAKEAAEAANHAKSTFLANMSHEIRTPLNAVLGYSQLMLRDPCLSVGAKENLHIINRSGEHLLALITDILDMAKIEAGKTTLNPVIFDLHELLADLDVMFRLRAQAKGLHFEVQVTPACERYIEADKGKLRQVLINLTGNAIKFTEAGSVTLRVSTRRNEDGRVMLAGSVEDTGPGIALTEQSRLFRPFSQSESGRNLHGGTGLGLAISREFVRLLGGDIGLSSELGGGSTLYFDIPVKPAEAGTLPEEKPRRKVAALQSGEDVRVLVVDDEPHNRGWLTSLLTMVGFSMKEAPDGAAAIELWREWRPQLILMDLRMPVMNGMEATRRIRAEWGGQEVVILALTAHAMEDKRKEAVNSGINDFISKPCGEGELLQKIQMHLGLSYSYAEDDDDVHSSSPVDAGQTSSLELPCDLPADLTADLQRAVESGEKRYLDQLIEKVAETDRQTARSLKQLADNYEYDTLNEHLRRMTSELGA